jgi:hypothetical protein
MEELTGVNAALHAVPVGIVRGQDAVIDAA